MQSAFTVMGQRIRLLLVLKAQYWNIFLYIIYLFYLTYSVRLIERSAIYPWRTQCRAVLINFINTSIIKLSVGPEFLIDFSSSEVKGEIPFSKPPTTLCAAHSWLPPWCACLGSQLPVSVEVSLLVCWERKEENLQDMASGYQQWSLCSTSVSLNSNYPEAKQSSQICHWSWAKV